MALHNTWPPRRSGAPASAEAADIVRGTLAALAADGLPCPVVSGGGSGTCRYDAESGVFTEIQAGSYVVMDVEYADCKVGFEHSLYLLAQVMSAPRSGVAIVDAGMKAFTVERGCRGLRRRTSRVGGRYGGRRSDEHATLDVRQAAAPRIGAKVRFIPPHCDPTVNLHDWLVCIRGERVVDLWPISARGPGF